MHRQFEKAGAPMPQPRDDFWNDETRKRLGDDWKSGLSASEIAAAFNSEFGTSFSRSAILGKLHRLHLSGGRPPIQVKSRPEIRSRKSKQIPKILALKPNKEPAPPVDLSIKPKLVTWDELEWDSCRWPFGDPQSDEFRFCGDTKLEGRSYCAGHCRMAYIPIGAAGPRKSRVDGHRISPRTCG